MPPSHRPAVIGLSSIDLSALETGLGRFSTVHLYVFYILAVLFVCFLSVDPLITIFISSVEVLKILYEQLVRVVLAEFPSCLLHLVWPCVLPPRSEMDDTLVHRSARRHNFRRRLAAMSSPALPPSAYSFFPYSSASPAPGPFLYPMYNLYPSGSLPPLSFNHPGLPPRPPATAAKYDPFPHRSSTLPPRPSAVAKVKQTTVTGMAVSAPRKMLECKSKKPRTPRSTQEPPRAQRRKPLQRAAPLPATSAVKAALDDLEREVTRGFVEDLLHALAPPPSSLPLPTFSLVRAACTKVPAPCTV